MPVIEPFSEAFAVSIFYPLSFSLLKDSLIMPPVSRSLMIMVGVAELFSDIPDFFKLLDVDGFVYSSIKSEYRYFCSFLSSSSITYSALLLCTTSKVCVLTIFTVPPFALILPLSCFLREEPPLALLFLSPFFLFEEVLLDFVSLS